MVCNDGRLPLTGTSEVGNTGGLDVDGAVADKERLSGIDVLAAELESAEYDRSESLSRSTIYPFHPSMLRRFTDGMDEDCS
jgi:hypothetical protein